MTNQTADKRKAKGKIKEKKQIIVYKVNQKEGGADWRSGITIYSD